MRRFALLLALGLALSACQAKDSHRYSEVLGAVVVDADIACRGVRC